MASKEKDEFRNRLETFLESAGTTLKAAADVCRKFGLVREEELPFHIGTTMSLADPKAFYAAASLRQAASYFNALRNMEEWKKALAGGKPVLVGLNVDRNWAKAADTNGSIE